MLDTIIYYATAPIRLFGRSRRFRLLIGALVLLVAVFYGTLWALDRFLPESPPPAFAKLPAPPPLPPMSRTSEVVTPVAIALSAIRNRLDATAPREFAGKNDNPVSKLLGQAKIGLTVSRGAMSVTGANDMLTVVTPLVGTIHITGQIGSAAGQAVGGIGGAIGGLLGGSVGKQIETLATKTFDQTSNFRGSVAVTARPQLLPNWRLDPRLLASIRFDNTSATLAGVKVNLGGDIRPMLDPAISSQIGALEARLRNDPFIERAARAQWAKMCRSIPLGGGGTGLPKLWLEVKPTKAFAAQPRIDGKAVTLTVGVQSQTRIVPRATKPDCPFPGSLDLVPAIEQGKLYVGLPIDVPFSDLNRLLEAQLKGHHFPEDRSGPVDVEVRGVHVAAAGDRLLIALRVHAREKTSWFGFGANATVYVWGKPALVAAKQVLRLTDASLAIHSQASLLGAAARAALPYLQQTLAAQAVVDLKPLAADARKKIGAALADFQAPAPGTRVEASVDELRLTGIAFDAHTLRIVAQASGTVKATVNELPKM
jgi:Domain of unknown function (DUF4403)